jgi:GNAT superfamily N-acetyltransferase
MRHQDLFEVSGILAESFPLSSEYLQWLIPLMRVGIQEDLRGRLRSTTPNYACFVAVDTVRSTKREDFLVGTVEVGLRYEGFWSPRSQQYPYLSNLAVRQDYRRQGIAQQLLLKCDRTAQSWGFESLYLHVLETNHGARQLYCKQGYRLEKAQLGLTSLLMGQPQRLFLRKDLAHDS